MNTDIRILKLAFENLLNEVESLKNQNIEMKGEISDLKEKIGQGVTPIIQQTIPEDVLLDTKDVLRILGVCYNTLQKVVEKGLLIPIRINQRRVRYSKMKILEYLRLKQQPSLG